MKTYKIATLALTLILCASISVAGNKGKKAKKAEAKVKTEITQQDIFNSLNTEFAKASEVVVVDANNVINNRIPTDTRNSMYNELQYPKFAQDDQKQDLVVISFTYKEDGFMQVLSINSSDQELNQYIISKLENIRLKDGSVTIGKAYNAKFHFKLL